MYKPPSVGLAKNAESPLRPIRNRPSVSETPRKYAQAGMRPGGLTRYSEAPVPAAMVECRPVGAHGHGSPDRSIFGLNAAHTPVSSKIPVTRQPVRTSAPALSAASTSNASRVSRRTHDPGVGNSGGSPVGSIRAFSLIRLNRFNGTAPRQQLGRAHRVRQGSTRRSITCVDGVSRVNAPDRATTPASPIGPTWRPTVSRRSVR